MGGLAGEPADQTNLVRFGSGLPGIRSGTPELPFDFGLIGSGVAFLYSRARRDSDVGS